MDKKKFEELINRAESHKIDFKSQQYDIIKDKTGEKTAEFIKDIISFTNTIRNESAYIILGIEELKDGTKIFHGINKHIDDETFQQKIKDKVNPKPIFSYSIFDYENKKYGIIEIPIRYYSEPIAPINKLKGLESGRVYFRRGTSNSEASNSEIIEINDWFRTLKQINSSIHKGSNLSDVLIKLNKIDTPLAPIASELLNYATKINNNEIAQFFESEVKGWDHENIKQYPKNFFNYRKIKAVYSPLEIKGMEGADNGIRAYRDLIKREDSKEIEIIFDPPISTLDKEITRIKENGIGKLYSQKRDIPKLLRNSSLSGEIMLYYLYDNYIELIQNIRYKYIEKLMELMK